MFMLYKLLVLLLLTSSIAQIYQPTTNNTIASCMDARVVDNSKAYCTQADWTAAHIYATVNFTNYGPNAPLSDSSQNSLAVNIYNSYLGGRQNLGSDCRSALQRLACVTGM